MKRLFAVLVLVASFLVAPRESRSETIVALTLADQIFSFDSATPGNISSLVPVTVAPIAVSVVGIDFRPAVPGHLVGVAATRTGFGSVYTIDPFTGVATEINMIPSLSGASTGVDFDPVTDELRIVNNNGVNLRITAGGAGVVNVDGNLNPGTPSVTGLAYANNVPGGDGGVRTLYGIDWVQDVLVTQGSPNFPIGPVSPNSGTLLTVGSLGVDTGSLLGFDISGTTGVAYAALSPAGFASSSLYSINLETGAATLIGPIGPGNLPLTGISLLADPVPGSLMLLGVGLFCLASCRLRKK
jgi:hypothetical protein